MKKLEVQLNNKFYLLLEIEDNAFDFKLGKHRDVNTIEYQLPYKHIEGVSTIGFHNKEYGPRYKEIIGLGTELKENPENDSLFIDWNTELSNTLVILMT